MLSLQDNSIAYNEPIKDVTHREANKRRNYDLVWILLREGPIEGLDLKDVDFFAAIREGHRKDDDRGGNSIA